MRIAAWCCIVAVAVLSLLPSDKVLRTDLGGHIEHVVAYAVTAVVVALGHRNSPITLLFPALLIYAACLEYLQRFSLGRTSDIVDFAFSALGVGIGLVFVLGTSKLWPSRTRRGDPPSR